MKIKNIDNARHVKDILAFAYAPGSAIKKFLQAMDKVSSRAGSHSAAAGTVDPAKAIRAEGLLDIVGGQDENPPKALTSTGHAKPLVAPLGAVPKQLQHAGKQPQVSHPGCADRPFIPFTLKTVPVGGNASRSPLNPDGLQTCRQVPTENLIGQWPVEGGGTVHPGFENLDAKREGKPFALNALQSFYPRGCV